MKKDILGKSKAIKDLLSLIERVGPAKTSVLITGESGTGKELVAKLLHEKSGIKNKPFVPVNCGAIPENLIESELFGHKRGSFTGAVSDKPGLFEVANTGTIFLDEVGELPLGMQVKLLRVLQDRTFRRVGDTHDIHVDVRILAATNRDLEKEIASGRFREDLYYRLNVIHIKTPPLRDREGDVELLADFFLKKYAGLMKKNITGFEPAALEAIRVYPWPGNVRELENAIERSVALESGTTVNVSVLPIQLGVGTGIGDTAGGSPDVRPDVAMSGNMIQIAAPDFSTGPIDLDAILGGVERKFLEAALTHAGGVKKKAADLLGITFRSIRYRLKKLGVETSLDSSDEGDSD